MTTISETYSELIKKESISTLFGLLDFYPLSDQIRESTTEKNIKELLDVHNIVFNCDIIDLARYIFDEYSEYQWERRHNG